MRRKKLLKPTLGLLENIALSVAKSVTVVQKPEQSYVRIVVVILWLMKQNVAPSQKHQYLAIHKHVKRLVLLQILVEVHEVVMLHLDVIMLVDPQRQTTVLVLVVEQQLITMDLLHDVDIKLQYVVS